MSDRPEDVSLAAAALADLQRARDEAAEAERRADLEFVGARLVEAIAGALAEHNHSRQIDEILYPTEDVEARGNGPLRPDDREPFLKKAKDEAPLRRPLARSRTHGGIRRRSRQGNGFMRGIIFGGFSRLQSRPAASARPVSSL